MVVVLQFGLLSLIGAQVLTGDESSLLQAQAFQKRATAVDVVQSQTVGLEGATVDKKKNVEGGVHGKSKKKKSHHGYELLGEGKCSPMLDDKWNGANNCIEACARDAACTGFSEFPGGTCEMSHAPIRGWIQDAQACPPYVNGDMIRDATCFREVESSNGTKCKDCEVVSVSQYNRHWFRHNVQGALESCDETRQVMAGVHSTVEFGGQSAAAFCNVFHVMQNRSSQDGHARSWWDRAGSCYKKL